MCRRRAMETQKDNQAPSRPLLPERYCRRYSQKNQPLHLAQRTLISFLLFLVLACEGFVAALPGKPRNTLPAQMPPRIRSTMIIPHKGRNDEFIVSNRQIQIRGGGGIAASASSTNPSSSPLTTLFLRFSSYVGASRRRCFMLLCTAIILESFSTLLSKRAKDTGSVLVFLSAVLIYVTCMVGFNISLAKINVSVAYALWSAIGTLLVTTAGIVFFGESIDLLKVLYLAMIVIGVVGLNLKSS